MSGNLDIHVVRDPNWEYDLAKGDRPINLAFQPDEWVALFFDVLDCPEPERYAEGEDFNEYEERYRVKFQQAIPKYPMLGRIWDVYQDIGYAPTEVEQLRDECLKVQASATNPRALEGLRKLILACNEAQRLGMGLFLASD